MFRELTDNEALVLGAVHHFRDTYEATMNSLNEGKHTRGHANKRAANRANRQRRRKHAKRQGKR